MRLITTDGKRTARPLTDLDKLIILARRTPYRDMNEAAKLRLKLLLAWEHQQREILRFGHNPKRR
jgi:hypothetical protein